MAGRELYTVCTEHDCDALVTEESLHVSTIVLVAWCLAGELPGHEITVTE